MERQTSSYDELPWERVSTNEPAWLEDRPGDCQVTFFEARTGFGSYMAQWRALETALHVTSGPTYVLEVPFEKLGVVMHLEKRTVKVAITLSDGWELVKKDGQQSNRL